MAPGTPDGPFNPSDNAKVTQWGCPVLGNCLCTWPSQFLPHCHQDAVMPPGAGITLHLPANTQGDPTVLPLHPQAEGQEGAAVRAGPASPAAPSTPSPPPLFRMSLAQPALLGTVITRCLARCPAGMDVFLMTGCSAKPHIQRRAAPGLPSPKRAQGELPGEQARGAAGLCPPSWKAPGGSGTRQAAPDPSGSTS